MDQSLFEVVWPLGRHAGATTKLAPGLPDLNGKTVAELWDGVYRGNQVFPILRDELKKAYPNVKIIDYSTMGISYGNVREYIDKLPALLSEQRCDAVISAVGA